VRTEHRRPSGREGFTLIEVLVALVILAVGLLALEALGIGAARMVSRAQVQDELTQAAAAELETALHEIRESTTPVASYSRTVSVPRGSLQVSATPTSVSSISTRYDVVVTAVPTGTGTSPLSIDTLRLSSSVVH
jgi:prepilin-type N-terminal cleavage/methylation domain-containing protein